MDSKLSILKVGFVYTMGLRDAHGKVLHEETVHNVFTTEGMNYMLDAALGSRSKLNNFYLGLFEGNYTPLITDLAATFPGSATETTAYTQANRVAFAPIAVTNGVISNVGQEAQFTFSADKTVYGAFLTSSQAKGSVIGVLLSAAKFSSPQAAHAGNVLYLQAGCQLINL